MQFSFLVVDDEQLSRDYICDLISEFMPGALIHQAPSANRAVALIQELRPDILFLDIKMPGTSGFDLLNMVSARDFEVVFVTAHNHYAIQALREGACDYLLKPVKKADFKETLQRACDRRQKNLSPKQREHKDETYLDQKLTITFQQGMRMIRHGDILYLKADNSYTTLFLVNNEKVITTRPINKFEKLLDPRWFFRIHKSYIINMHHLREYVAKDSNIALLSDGTRLLISRYRLSSFLKHLKNNTESSAK